jgi:hypothetical protein
VVSKIHNVEIFQSLEEILDSHHHEAYQGAHVEANQTTGYKDKFHELNSLAIHIIDLTKVQIQTHPLFVHTKTRATLESAHHPNFELPNINRVRARTFGITNF